MPNRALRKERQARVAELRKERFTTVTASADAALKSAFLVNGGGAVALLAFFGQPSTAIRSPRTVSLLAAAMLALVIGTAVAAFATGLSFLAQYGYFVRKSKLGKAAKTLTALNIILVGFSNAAFVVAGGLAYWALS